MPALAPVLPAAGDQNWDKALNTALGEVLVQLNLNSDKLETTGLRGFASVGDVADLTAQAATELLNNPDSVASTVVRNLIDDAIGVEHDAERAYQLLTYALKKTRRTASVVTAVLADQAVATGTITLATSYRLLTISTTAPCRVRLYATDAQRIADAGRAIGTDPAGNHGLMLEFVATDTLLYAVLTPAIDGSSQEIVPSTAIPLSIQNLSGATAAITVSLGFLETE